MVTDSRFYYGHQKNSRYGYAALGAPMYYRTLHARCRLGVQLDAVIMALVLHLHESVPVGYCFCLVFAQSVNLRQIDTIYIPR